MKRSRVPWRRRKKRLGTARKPAPDLAALEVQADAAEGAERRRLQGKLFYYRHRDARIRAVAARDERRRAGLGPAEREAALQRKRDRSKGLL